MTTQTGDRPARRVVLSDMTRILAAIVRDLVGRETDLLYVGSVALPELPAALPSIRPDVVVIAPPRTDRARAARDELRQAAADLTVVEIRPRDDRAVVWHPGSGPEHIALSASGILAALRGVRSAERGAAPA